MINPFKVWREERQAERQHQEALLRAFLSSLELIQATAASESSDNAKALIEVAKAMTVQASSFGDWIKLFQPGAPPTSTNVREDDEYREEQIRALNAGMPADIAALPEEFRLAYILQHDPMQLEQP